MEIPGTLPRLAALALLSACTGSSSAPIDAAPPPATRPVEYKVTAFPFARRTDPIAIEVPPSSRPGGAAAPERFHPPAGFVVDKRLKAVTVYKTPLPVHSNLFPMREKGTHIFGNYAPPGLHVFGPEGELDQNRFVKQPGQYAFDREFLYVGVPPESSAPDPATIDIVFDKATRMENALNQAQSGRDLRSFVFRELTIDETAYTGLLLPAPSKISWSAQVPSDGVFATRATILPPAIRVAERSDGAQVILEVTSDGATTEIGRQRLSEGDWAGIRLDLSKFANKQVTVTLRTDPGASPDLDYVFLEEPTMYTPSEHPKRLVLVFVDTLRRDHLGMYGYARPTTPKLDAWAKNASIFEDARTVAPWTLPSARALLTGAQPEQWFETATLPQRLSEAGFHTHAIVTNAFLSETFDMQKGWSRYEFLMEHPVGEVAPRLVSDMEAYRDRDTAVMIHLMEAHMPYDEPSSYQGLFAKDKPAGLDEVSRKNLLKLAPTDPAFPDIKQYVMDRYDQNIRVVDDAIPALLEEAGPDATVILFADHGEEFWDHGHFEHGQAFGDELLRVPLVVRSPNLPAGRVAAPVSLLDVTPTALELMGLPHDAKSGISLVSAAWNDAGAADALTARPQAFGRPLYGPTGEGPSLDGWGVYTQAHKWWQRGGTQQLYDLAADPGESKDLTQDGAAGPYPAALQAALGRDVVAAWRIAIRNGRNIDGSKLVVHVPGGAKLAWNSYDPRGEYERTAPAIEGETVTLTQQKGNELPPAIYVVPNGDPRAPAGLSLELTSGAPLLGAILTAPGSPAAAPPAGVQAIPAPASLPFATHDDAFVSVGDAGWGLTVELVWVPVPGGVAVSGYSPEMKQELQELGYLQEE